MAPPPPGRDTADRGRRRGCLLLALVVLVVLGGGVAGAVVIGTRVVAGVRAPTDTANAYLDAARAGGAAEDLACDRTFEPDPILRGSEGQRLNSVSVRDGRVADVEGTLRLPDDRIAPVRVRLHREGDGWCVVAVSFPR